MPDLRHSFCPNKECDRYRQTDAGNIAVRGKCGKNKEKILLYCRVCGKRFVSSTGTLLYGAHLSRDTIRTILRLYSENNTMRGIAAILGISKVTVNNVIIKVSARSQIVLNELMESLELDPSGMEHLFALVKKRKLLEKRDGLDLKGSESLDKKEEEKPSKEGEKPSKEGEKPSKEGEKP
jgi:hypothetical protein